MIEKITSRNNEKIKMATSLLKSVSTRREQGLFLIEGMRLCADAFLSEIPIDTMFITAKAMEKYRDELAFIDKLDASIFEISEELAKRLSDTKSPQGIFCICKTLDKKFNIDKIKQKGFYLALDNIQTPDNLGAIIRTAEALGIDAIICGGGCDIYNPKVQRAAMGAALRMDIFNTNTLAQILRDCSHIIPSFACVIDKSALPINDIDFSRGCICVVGNEGAGVSDEVVAACKQRITIPMRGRSESLNVAAAAAIVCFAAVSD